MRNLHSALFVSVQRPRSARRLGNSQRLAHVGKDEPRRPVQVRNADVLTLEVLSVRRMDPFSSSSSLLAAWAIGCVEIAGTNLFLGLPQDHRWA